MRNYTIGDGACGSDLDAQSKKKKKKWIKNKLINFFNNNFS